MLKTQSSSVIMLGWSLLTCLMLISMYSEISGQKTVSDGILFLLVKFVYTVTH